MTGAPAGEFTPRRARLSTSAGYKVSRGTAAMVRTWGTPSRRATALEQTTPGLGWSTSTATR